MIDLEALLIRSDGILLAREHRSLKSSISRWFRAGRLARLLPGVYVHPEARHDLQTRLRAASARVPDGVIAGAAAAHLTHWPNEPVGEIEVLVRSRRVAAPGFRFVRRKVPPELLTQRSGLPVLAPPLVAVDSADTDNGSRIDDLLRAHWPLERIIAAFGASPGRRGNPRRRRVVDRSRTTPWSQAERRLHDILDRHRIAGWTANLPVTACGRNYWLDAGFEAIRLAVEVDGWEFHSSRGAFESDHDRCNDLSEAGWDLLRFTARMLDDEAEVARRVRAFISRARARRRRGAG